MRKLVKMFLIAAALAASATAGATMLADGTRISERMRAQLQKVLDDRFGPGRCVAQVQVGLKLSTEAHGWLSRLLSPPEKAGPAPSQERFNWAWLGTKPPASDNRFVLPGVPDSKKDAAAGPAQPGQEDSEPPASALVDVIRSFGMEIDHVEAHVVLDASLPAEADEQALALAQAATGASRVRGDVVAVQRGKMPGQLRRLLEDPGTLGTLSRQLSWLLLALVALLASSSLFWRFTSVLCHGADRFAEALQGAGRPALQAQAPGALTLQIPSPEEEKGSLEPFAPKALAAEEESRRGSGRPRSGLEEEGKALQVKGAAAPAAPQEIVIRVGIENVERLAHLLEGQTAENVALVMPYLEPDVRRRFLEIVPFEQAQQVVLAMCPMRYVEPELLIALKDEMERRVHGVVGGISQVVEMLESSDERRREDLLEALRAKDPAAAADIRRRLLSFADLLRLTQEELSAVAEAAGVEALAAACAGAQEPASALCMAALPKSAQRVFSESVDLLKAAPDPARSAQARESVVKAAAKLIGEGRIARPPERIDDEQEGA